MHRSVALIVLDGWGIGRKDESNPIHVVKPQTFAWLEENFPKTSLQASGISVGLPWGEVGNSEVGHLTLGAGKVLYQYYPKITLAIKNGAFFKNPALLKAFAHAKKNNSAVNIAGLLTKANVHASLEHLTALLALAEREKVSNIRLHLFADGKDSPPRTLSHLLSSLPREKIATIMGRYYAMDREERFELIRQAYECLTAGGGRRVQNLEAELEEFYKKDLTEEFLPPLRLMGPEGNISENDALIFFNFREDSMRELAGAFLSPTWSAFPAKKFKNLQITTFTPYSEKFGGESAFMPDKVDSPLAKVLADAGKAQLRLAETYKYAHVTYFFNGFRDDPFKNEYRVFIPSETIPHPDSHPQMMAAAITDRLLSALSANSFEFILVNYANPDVIAHTGNYEASLEAVRAIDREIARVIKTLTPDTVLMITSDHGNVEQMVHPVTGRAETQHDPNPVPLHIVHPDVRGRKFINHKNWEAETAGILSDVAPTILSLLNIKVPPEMTGENLLEKLV